MTAASWGQLALFSALVLLTTKPLGAYMVRVFESDRRPLPGFFGPVERFLFRLSGVDPSVEQTWTRYAGSVLALSVFSLLVTYAILRLQHLLPLNPQKFPAVDPALAFNTSASFTTNTNWQAYGGESTMSYLSQMAGLAWHNFISAAAGIGVAIALARGLTRRQSPDAPRTLGNARNPRTIYYDLSVRKSFDIGERVRLQIRADAINVLNHTNFFLGSGSTSQHTLDSSLNNLNINFGDISAVNGGRSIGLGIMVTF